MIAANTPAWVSKSNQRSGVGIGNFFLKRSFVGSCNKINPGNFLNDTLLRPSQVYNSAICVILL